ncbi:unnamed protein product [Cuscuta europaea]|uniref:Uncharacterized protein n=1 Tax=Cuscuta europaea TaxID=41803 RepID=A0A9P1E713_CUSEU|nr:unnamed protein product [Cuscuta europaea]
MDVGSLFALKNVKGKKKAPAGTSAREGPSQPAGTAAGAGGSRGAGPVKKKNAGKGTESLAKKLKTAAPAKQPATDVVVIVDEGHASAPTPLGTNQPGVLWAGEAGGASAEGSFRVGGQPEPFGTDEPDAAVG